MNNSEHGSALIVVLLVLAFVSSASVLFVYYTQWQSRLNTVPQRTMIADEGMRFARDRVQDYFQNQLSDTPTLPSPVVKEWELPPSTTIRARITSLNAQFNLNTLIRSDDQSARIILKGFLERFGYPSRSLEELRDWVTEDTGTANPRYAGYGYRSPDRDVYHLDEVSLVSGFIQRGVNSQFRELFTVYGTGRFNPQHLTPGQWKLLRSFPDLNVPELPTEARQSEENFRNFLQQKRVQKILSERFPFMTDRDDSFRVDYRIETRTFQRRYRSIYEYEYLDNTLTLKTRYPIQDKDTSSESFSESELRSIL